MADSSLNDGQRPQVSPEEPGGLNQWIMYLSDRAAVSAVLAEQTSKWQKAQNNQIGYLRDDIRSLRNDISSLPCDVREERIRNLERNNERRKDQIDRKVSDVRKAGWSLWTKVVVGTGLVVLGALINAFFGV